MRHRYLLNMDGFISMGHGHVYEVVAPFFSLRLHPYTSLRGSACVDFAGRSDSKVLTLIVHCDRLVDAYRLNQF